MTKEQTPPTPEQKEVGARLRRARQAKGWTLEHVADLTGSNISAISKMEQGYRIPKVVIPCLEKLYGKTAEMFMGVAGEYVEVGSEQHKLLSRFAELSPENRSHVVAFAAYLADMGDSLCG